jgi:protein gp37
MSTKIQWTDESWNPIIGCTKISEGCLNCYAEKMANRLSAIALSKSNEEIGFDISGIGNYSLVTNNGKWNGITKKVPSALEKPFHWKKPRKIFVCSMGDLFHESVPFEWIDQIFMIIAQLSRHTFQILTKRPDVMLKYFSRFKFKLFDTWEYEWPLNNVWLGVTTENQEQADKRISILLQIPAKVRFISCEPLLNEIHIERYLISGADGFPEEMDKYHDWIDWVIVGPETGPKARPMQKEWIDNLAIQCLNFDVPFFDKKDILGKGI